MRTAKRPGFTGRLYLNMPTSVDYIEIRGLHDLYRCMDGRKKAIFRYIVVEGEPREDYIGELCKIEYEDGSYRSFNLGLKNQDGIQQCYWHENMIRGEPRTARMAAQLISRRSTDTVEETNPFDNEDEDWDGVTISPIEEKNDPDIFEESESRVARIIRDEQSMGNVTHDGFGNPY